MRIDEFSNATSIDGEISSTEQTQFLLFGFDIGLAESIIIIVDTPDSRILRVAYEDRNFTVAYEDRNSTVAYEDRNFTV